MKNTVSVFRHGQTPVGTTMVQVSSDNFKFVKGLNLQAARDNTNVIYVGGPGVTVNDGMPLTPGEALFLPLENGTLLYAISTAADQKLAWIGM